MLIIVILSPGSQEDGKLTEKTTKVTHKIESIQSNLHILEQEYSMRFHMGKEL